MFCITCGTAVTEGWRFCKACGREVYVPQRLQQAVTDDGPGGLASSGRWGRAIAVKAAAAVLALGVVVLAVVLATNSPNEKLPPTAPLAGAQRGAATNAPSSPSVSGIPETASPTATQAAERKRPVGADGETRPPKVAVPPIGASPGASKAPDGTDKASATNVQATPKS